MTHRNDRREGFEEGYELGYRDGESSLQADISAKELTREDFFKEIMTEFQSKAIDMIEEVASKAVTEYLPHIESDTEFNAQQIAEGMLQDFLADRRTYRTEWFVTNMSASNVRKKILEEYPKELKQGIIKDLQEEIEHLKISLENAYRRY